MTRRRFDSSYDAPANALTPERMDVLLAQSEHEREGARADAFVSTLRDEHDLGHHGQGDPVHARVRKRVVRQARDDRRNREGVFSRTRASWILRNHDDLDPKLVDAAKRFLDGQTTNTTPSS